MVSPSILRKDVKVLECVQKRATKLMKGMEGMSADEWMRSLCLSVLEKLRMERDLLDSTDI